MRVEYSAPLNLYTWTGDENVLMLEQSVGKVPFVPFEATVGADGLIDLAKSYEESELWVQALMCLKEAEKREPLQRCGLQCTSSSSTSSTSRWLRRRKTQRAWRNTDGWWKSGSSPRGTCEVGSLRAAAVYGRRVDSPWRIRKIRRIQPRRARPSVHPRSEPQRPSAARWRPDCGRRRA